MEITDDELRALWREQGGSFHGPKVETGTMPEAQLLPWLRELIRVSRWAAATFAGESGIHVNTGGKSQDETLFSALDVQAFTAIGFAMRKKHETDRVAQLELALNQIKNGCVDDGDEENRYFRLSPSELRRIAMEAIGEQRCQCGEQPWHAGAVEIKDSRGKLHYSERSCGT